MEASFHHIQIGSVSVLIGGKCVQPHLPFFVGRMHTQVKCTCTARRTHLRCNCDEAPHDSLWHSERAVPAARLSFQPELARPWKFR